MKIADYIVLISPAGLPFFSLGREGLEEPQQDPIMFGSILKALEDFSKEVIFKTDEKPSEIHHFNWKNFTITLCNPLANIWNQSVSDVEKPKHKPLLATINLIGKPHLEDQIVLEGILKYLFDDLDLEENMIALEDTGKIPEEFNQKLTPRIRSAFFGESDRFTSSTDGLIVSVGTSWGSIFSALQLHSPKFTFFICSENSESFARQICRTFGLVEREDYEICLTNQDNTSMVVQTAAETHQRLLKKLGESARITINATGGTKSLTAGLMFYGFVRNINTYYVLSKLFRQHHEDRFYGDEELLLVDNPVQTVGYFYEKQAINAFNMHIFKEASIYLDLLAQNIHDLTVATYFEGLAYLSEAYFRQKNQQYNKMLIPLQQAFKKLKRFGHTKHTYVQIVKTEMLPLIQKQVNLVQELSSQPTNKLINILAQMHQCNLLKDEEAYPLAILQGNFVLNMIFGYILQEKSLDMAQRQPFDSFSYILPLEIRIAELKKQNHQFLTQFDQDYFNKLVTSFKEIFKDDGISMPCSDEFKFYSTLELVNQCFKVFLHYIDNPQAVENFTSFQFLHIKKPIL